MDSTKYIGMDVHQETTSIAVMNSAGKLLMESILETKAMTIVPFVQGLRGNLPHISILSCSSESSDRRHHQYSCGCERDEDVPEVQTEWVRNKTSLFSSLLMLP